MVLWKAFCQAVNKSSKIFAASSSQTHSSLVSSLSFSFFLFLVPVLALLCAILSRAPIPLFPFLSRRFRYCVLFARRIPSYPSLILISCNCDPRSHCWFSKFRIILFPSMNAFQCKLSRCTLDNVKHILIYRHLFFRPFSSFSPCLYIYLQLFISTTPFRRKVGTPVVCVSAAFL